MPADDFYEDIGTPPPEPAETVVDAGPGNGAEKTVAGLLESSGVSALTENSTAEEIVEALGKFRAISGNRDILWLKVAQNSLAKKLKEIKFSSPTATVRELFKSDAQENNGQGQDVLFPDMEPWAEPVDGDRLAHEIRKTFEKHIVLPDGAGVALALWVIHTYAIEAAHHSPFVFLSSPEKRCGKTTVLKLLGALVNRPLPTGNISPAALFRTVEKYKPVLLIDEADRALKYNEEITGLLNTSHDRGNAFVIRTVGDDHEPRKFQVFGPKAIAGIGALADTIEDRAIILKMRRRAPGETVERLRGDRLYQFEYLKEKAVRWVADNVEKLKETDPAMPPELNDRAADNWRPLIAIADCIGGAWPSLARESAKILSCNATEDEDGPGVRLLADIRTLFSERDSDRLESQQIVSALHEMEDRPWPEYGRQRKPVSATGIARLLKKFGIKPSTHRFDSSLAKGYLKSDFEDAFLRYLPDSNVRAVTAVTRLKNKGLEKNQSVTKHLDVTDGKPYNLFKNNDVTAVTDGNRGTGGKKEKNKESEVEL